MHSFSTLLTQLHQFQNDESGQDIVEYALLGAMMALGTVSSVRSVATGAAGVFTSVGSTITTGI
jgi:pilus assembly protein Flp/PilA